MRADHERRVLVVDDEPTIVVTLQDDLEEHGYVVVTARDGLTALRWLADGAFAAVVTDLRLPGVDGAAVVRAAHARDLATRILVVSANFAGHEALLRAAGAEACLPKPFANREVLAWLEVRRTA